MEIFSKRLRALRAESGKLQAQVSDDLNLSRGILSAYENGREPSFETLTAIAQYFDVSTDYLLGLSEERKPAADDLGLAIECAAKASAQLGAVPVTSSDLIALADRISDYITSGAPADALPLDLLHNLISSSDALLSALSSRSTSAVLAASDALLLHVLRVSGVTNAFLQGKK